jgi:predicted ATP-dependent endonuclease of OLD family
MEGVSDLRVEYDTKSGNTANSMTIIVEEEKFDVKFNSKDISSGSKEILVLLTQIYLADRFANVLIIEEPELHVHPGAERKLFEILQDVVDRGTQVIVATHSDVFVNESEASNIVRVERDGHTQMRTLSEENTGKELAELGYNKSGLLQSEAVVFVEGRSDKRILKKFAKNSGVDLNSEGIAVVELEGIKNMLADAKSLVKLLYSFDIPYLFLRDKHDKPREAAQGELYDAMKRDDGSHWWEVPRDNIHVWNSYGIESYLLDAEAIAEGLEMEPSAVQEIIDSHQETDDKGEVLNKIYAEEHDDLDDIKDVYAKDRHGMEIASRIPPERFDSEVQDVIIKITELLDAWDRDRLNFQTSSDSN